MNKHFPLALNTWQDEKGTINCKSCAPDNSEDSSFCVFFVYQCLLLFTRPEIIWGRKRGGGGGCCNLQWFVISYQTVVQWVQFLNLSFRIRGELELVFLALWISIKIWIKKSPDNPHIPLCTWPIHYLFLLWLVISAANFVFASKMSKIGE